MNLLLFLLVVPVIAVVLIAIGRVSPRRTALWAAGLNFGASLVLLRKFWVEVPAGTSQFQEVFQLQKPWIELQGLFKIYFHLGVDGISLPLVLLTTIVTLAAVAVSPADIKRAREFYSYLLLISLGALGAFLSLDLFFLYIFHEFALIPTFLLIGIWGGQNRRLAGTQITLYLTLGSLVLLAGILALVLSMPGEVRTFNLPDIQAYLLANPLGDLQGRTIYPLLLIGFGILISLFPFHTWAPAGYAAAPAAAAMLHAGVLKKFGLYGLLRVAIPLFPEAAGVWEPALTILLLGNIVYVGLVALAQKDLLQLLGFSSVMHMGYLFLGLVAWNGLGVSGVILLMVGHGLSAALLFALAGEIRQRTGETRLAELGGLAQKAPFLAIAFVIASLASVGLPGLANFSGELLIFFGAWKEHPWATALALWGVVISSVYTLRAVRAVLFGDLPAKFAQVADIGTWKERAPYVLLIAASLVLGFAPQPFLKFIQPCVVALLKGAY
jgi:NADH-quinone oxidoreductase subunit M